MYRIKSITFENFKYFYAEQTLLLEQNNLLLYGENGSGKSSIYWGLYTFLQSVLKDDINEVRNYFDRSKPERLLNRFSEVNPNSKGSIVVDFEKEDGTGIKKTISLDSINTKSGNIVKEAARSSDFINYKLLARLYDFRNSQDIDLFDFFERDILIFITFRNSFVKQNNDVGSDNASEWWKYLKAGMKPRGRMNEPPYKNFQFAVNQFNSEFMLFLNKITQSTNEYLRNVFNQPLKIVFEYKNATYDEFIPNTKKRNRIVKQPKILLKVEYLHHKLNEGKEYLPRPQTFLNEAVLTTIALSIRFAILDEKMISEAPKILVLDDLLLSLDMSNRNTVLDIILNKSSDYQLMILTHDRMFFEMAKHKIKTLGQTNWKYLEAYTQIKNEIPRPYITESESHLGKAIKFFNRKEFEAAGNFLRKEAESFVDEFLPRRMHFDRNYQLLDLNGKILKCIDFATKNEVRETYFLKLDSHRKFIFNPSSHHSYDVPKFKSEIETCIETLSELRKIKIRKVFDRGEKIEFELTDREGDVYKFEITIEDNLKLIKIESQTPILSMGLLNYYVYKNGIKTNDNLKYKVDSIKKMYEKCYANSDKSKSSDFWKEVKFAIDGSSIKSRFNLFDAN